MSDPKPNETSESTLANKWLDLKVLDQTIRARETRLKTVERSIENAEKRLASIQADTRRFGQQKVKASADTQTALKSLDNTLRENRAKIDAVRFELHTLNDEIKNRQSYKEDQESKISEMVEEGNQKLLSIKYEIENLERVKQVIENEIYESRQQLDGFDEKLLQVKQDALDQEKILTEAVSKKQLELDGLTKEVRQADLKLKQISDETDRKLMTLKEKEESLVAREGSIKVRTEDLNRRERRLNNTESLYG